MPDLARHSTPAPFGCCAPLKLRIEKSVRPIYESMIVERCEHCGRCVNAWGVVPEPVNSREDGAYGV